MKSAFNKWLVFNLVCCFAVYWLSNLILWYPWSINENLGQILMLTINPLLWGYASYVCIVCYPKTDNITGVFLTSVVYTVEAIFSDLIFFVLIQHGANKLMRATTFYAWVFVLCLPWIVYVLFKKQILSEKKILKSSDFKAPIIIGVVSFILISLIVLLGLKFTK